MRVRSSGFATDLAVLRAGGLALDADVSMVLTAHAVARVGRPGVRGPAVTATRRVSYERAPSDAAVVVVLRVPTHDGAREPTVARRRCARRCTFPGHPLCRSRVDVTPVGDRRCHIDTLNPLPSGPRGG